MKPDIASVFTESIYLPLSEQHSKDYPFIEVVVAHLEQDGVRLFALSSSTPPSEIYLSDEALEHLVEARTKHLKRREAEDEA